MGVRGDGRFIQAFQRVLANGLEHAEAPAPPTPHEALDDERLQTVEVRIADGLRRAQGERAAEDSQPAKERLLFGREQLVAPLDSRPEGALPARRIARL